MERHMYLKTDIYEKKEMTPDWDRARWLYARRAYHNRMMATLTDYSLHDYDNDCDWSDSDVDDFFPHDIFDKDCLTAEVFEYESGVYNGTPAKKPICKKVKNFRGDSYPRCSNFSAHSGISWLDALKNNTYLNGIISETDIEVRNKREKEFRSIKYLLSLARDKEIDRRAEELRAERDAALIAEVRDRERLHDIKKQQERYEYVKETERTRINEIRAHDEFWASL
jgi:hypothetical protein